MLRSAPLKTFRTTAFYAVAAAIAQARKAAGLTQRELARVLRWPHSVIGAIESKRQQVNVPAFTAIADAIGIEPAELFALGLRLNPQRAAARIIYRSRRRDVLARKRASAAKRTKLRGADD